MPRSIWKGAVSFGLVTIHKPDHEIERRRRSKSHLEKPRAANLMQQVADARQQVAGGQRLQQVLIVAVLALHPRLHLGFADGAPA